MRRAAPVLLLLASAAHAEAPEPTLAALLDCAALAQERGGDFDAIVGACPDIEQRLEAAGLLQWLDGDWRARLGPRGLRDLAGLAGRYREPVPRAPSVGAVPGVLSGIADETQPPPRSWWARLKDWLHDLFTRSERAPRAPLPEWLRGLAPSAAAWRVIEYLIIALVIVAAVVLIARELRAEGVLETHGRRRRRRADGAPDDPTMAAEPVDAAPPERRARLLLELLVQRLVAAGRLVSGRALTHRELSRAARFDSDEERGAFDALAGLAERLAFGADRRPGPAAESVLRDGRRLAERLGGGRP